MLQFLGREAGHKGLVDDGMEAPDEGHGLPLDLSVHPEVSHVVNVADPETTMTQLTREITQLMQLTESNVADSEINTADSRQHS